MAVYYGDFEEWSDRTYEFFEHHYGNYPNNEQDEWIKAIWDEYNQDGYIDWDDKHADSAWYMMLTEVYGYDHEAIEKYMDTT